MGLYLLIGLFYLTLEGDTQWFIRKLFEVFRCMDVSKPGDWMYVVGMFIGFIICLVVYPINIIRNAVM